MVENSNNDKDKIKRFTFLNTNARSLCPKLESLLIAVEETSAALAIVTETWMRDGEDLEDVRVDLSEGHGLDMICRNRPVGDNRLAHGGVAVLYKKNLLNLKQIDVGNTEGFEIVGALGNIRGILRKLLVLGCYVPPNYTARRGKQFLDYLTDLILHLKRKYTDPYILVGGDFNQWDLSAALEDYKDLQEVHVGATRGNKAIDRCFHNFGECIKKAGVLPPLETPDSAKKSDHLLVYAEAEIPRFEAYELITYSYRRYTEEAGEAFREWVVMHDWAGVLSAAGSNAKAAEYQRVVDCAMDVFFPVQTTTRKSSDYPWINWKVRRKVKQRRSVYYREGRSVKWKKLKKLTDNLIKKRRAVYMDSQRMVLLEKDSERSFYKNIRSYKSGEIQGSLM